MSMFVLNAAVGCYGLVENYEMRRFDKIIEVNLRAPFALLQACLPLLRQGAEADAYRGARVVVLSSVAGIYPELGLGAYGATKAAICSLTDVFNLEEAAHGVSATAIAPGFVQTDMSIWAEDRVQVRI